MLNFFPVKLGINKNFCQHNSLHTLFMVTVEMCLLRQDMKNQAEYMPLSLYNDQNTEQIHFFY